MARPLLDVSDVLDDPLFRDDTLVCTRKTQTVGANGRATNADTVIPFAGVVTSLGGEMLKRLPEGSHVSQTILVITKFKLTSGEPGRDADVVTYNGSAYTVSIVDDYSAYGAGFVQAGCLLIPLSG